MFIEKFTLERFKGFENFTVKLSQVTCLVGPNSGGKTSVLQAVDLLHAMLRYAFGGGETPDFSSPRWVANPADVLRSVSQGDPDAVWLDKRTAEACTLSGSFAGDVQVRVVISGPSRYEVDVLVAEESVKGALDSPSVRDVVEALFRNRPVYVPPVGLVSAMERWQTHPQVEAESLEHENWRSRLWWFCNDGQRDAFDEVVATVEQYLPSAQVLPPRLTHSNPARVLVEYREDGTEFDISTSGGGLRTVLNLAVVLEFAESRCLLLDEPDSHLHGSLQRVLAQMLLDHAVEENRQVIIATHAPEMIAEFPTDALVWIDRRRHAGEGCSDVGRVLADLGCLTKADALRVHGVNKILFIEGGLDGQVLKQLLGRSGRCSPFDDQTAVVAELPNGKGDSVHIPVLKNMIRAVLKLDLAMCCVVDNDYDIPASLGRTEVADASEACIFRLDRKEIENYLISPPVVARAARADADRRAGRAGGEVPSPTKEDVQSELDRILDDTRVKESVCLQILQRRYALMPPEERQKAAQAMLSVKWFEEKWADAHWRMANCPGKAVLAALRQWCQSSYHLTLTPKLLVDSLEECPSAIVAIARGVEECLYGTASSEQASGVPSGIVEAAASQPPTEPA